MTWRSATAGGDVGLVDCESRLSSQRALNSLGLSDDQADAILEPVFRDRRDDVEASRHSHYRLQRRQRRVHRRSRLIRHQTQAPIQ